jgi:hypothetical protein
MKSITNLLAAIAYLASWCTAAAGPKLVIAHPIHDFGTVPEGEMVRHQFVLENAGDQKLTITSIRSTCPCLEVIPSKTEFSPGESGFIEALFDTDGYEGAVTKTALIQSSDPDQSTQSIRVTGIVEPEEDKKRLEDLTQPLPADSGVAIYGLGEGLELSQDSTYWIQRYHIQNRSSQTIAITSTECSLKGAELLLSKESVQPGNTAVLTIRVPAGKDRVKPKSGDLNIYVSLPLQ